MLQQLPPSEWQSELASLEWVYSDQISAPQTLTYEISGEVLVSGFQRWKESTSTSPSRRYLSLYKVLLQKYSHREEQDYQENFSKIFASILNISVQSQTILPRWSTVHSILLPKDDGCRVHRFRLLHLYEADLNLFLKILVAKKIRDKVEENGLGNEQWGGRKEKSAPDMGLSAALTFDYCKMSGTSIGYVDLDAAACFTRIIRSIAILGFLKVGAHTSFATWYLSLMDQMKHHLVTTYGVGPSSFPENDLQFEGVGQGSTTAGNAWTILDSMIVKEYNKHVILLTITCPSRQVVVTKTSDTFVDDRKLWIPGNDDNQIRSRIKTYMELIQFLISETGGGLNLHKCSWSIIHKEAAETDPIYITRLPHDKAMIARAVTNIQNTPTFHSLQEVSRLSGVPLPKDTDAHTHDYFIIRAQSDAVTKYVAPNATQRSIGFYFNLLNITASVDQIITIKINEFFHKNMSARLTITDVQRGLIHNLIPRLTYIVQANHASEKHLISESNRLYSILMPLMGANLHTPMAIRFTPLARLGMTFPHLYCEMVIVKVKQVLKHIRNQNTIGKLLLITIRWTQNLFGTQLNILENTEHRIDYINTIWWHGIKKFLHMINGKLWFEDTVVPSPNVILDVAIMDRVNSEKFSLAEKRVINKVRLFLQVTFLSDITHPHLPQLLPCFLEGKSDTNSTSLLSWPDISPPTPHEGRLWKRAMLILFAIDGTLQLRDNPS